MKTLGIAGEVLTGDELGVEQAVRSGKNKRKKVISFRIWRVDRSNNFADIDCLLDGLLELLEGCHPGNGIDKIR